MTKNLGIIYRYVGALFIQTAIRTHDSKKIVGASIKGYDESDSDGAHLILDHSVFEYTLANVINYLRTAPNSVQEMVKVANIMGSLGKAPYLILEGEQEQHYARLHKTFGVQLETIDSLPNFCWLTLGPRGAWKPHPNCIFIPDPVIVKRMWEPALKEMCRWNKDKS